MATKLHKKLSPQLNTLVDKLVDLFDVRSWDIGWQFPTESHPIAAAEVKIDEKYQRLTIVFYPEFFKVSLEKQRLYLLHEFCHLNTDSLVALLDQITKEGKHITPDQITFHSERATSRMTSILDGFLTGGWKEKKKAYGACVDKPKQIKK